jgi:DNA-binding transcriptional MocR family regulator
VVQLANDIGVKLTPAGATFPYGEDPEDCNIRLAPTFPSQKSVEASIRAFITCVKLASVRQRLQQLTS